MDGRPPEAHSDRAIAVAKFRALPPRAKMELPTPPLLRSAHAAATLATRTQRALPPAAKDARPHRVFFAPRRAHRIRPTPFPRSAASRSEPRAPASRAQAP